MKNKKTRNYAINILVIICVLVFAGSGFMVIKEYWQKSQEKAAFEDLAKELHTVEEQSWDDASYEELVLKRYASMQQDNPDFAGWIRIDGTSLDYPVMYTPENSEYYLRRGYDGSYSVSGTPFIGEGSTPESTNVLIYGHRMNNDTMFTVLLEYADKTFWEQHKEIRFDTVDKIQTFEVVSAFYIEIPYVDDTQAFRWYNYGGDISGEDMEYFAQQIKARAYYDTGIEIGEGDKLITLTTCAYNDEEQRFVVVARLAE